MATMSSSEDDAKQPSEQVSYNKIPHTITSQAIQPGNDDDDDDDTLSKASSSFDGSASMASERPITKKRKLSTGAGRWTEQEHKAFLLGLSRYGREWKRVAQDIPTRTSAQVRSHAQKYFAKISKHHEVSESVRMRAERIMADPVAAEREVQETLHQLKERYRQLKAQQEAETQQQNDAEMIAVDVLRGGLRNSP